MQTYMFWQEALESYWNKTKPC